jgi:hypothetical protein
MAETRQQKLERLQRRRDGLNNQISREAAKIQQADRKARDGRLMRWGIALDQALEHEDISREWLARLLDRHITRKADRLRAFSGPMLGYDPGMLRLPPPDPGSNNGGGTKLTRLGKRVHTPLTSLHGANPPFVADYRPARGA